MEVSRDRKQQVVIALAAVSRIASGALLGTVMAVYIGRNASPFAVSLALTVYFAGLLIFAPVWGAIADVTGRRRLILITTTILATATLLLLPMYNTVGAQIVLRGIYAVFVAGFTSVILTIVSERGGGDHRGKSIGFYSSAVAAGGISGRLLAGFLLGLLAPSSVYLVVAGISIPATVAVVFVADPLSSTGVQRRDRGLATEVRRRILPPEENRVHLQTNGLSWLYLAIFLRNMTNKGLGSVLPIFLLAEVGVTEVTMGALFALSPTLRTGVMLLFGRITDIIGRKPLITTGATGAGFRALTMAGATFPDTLAIRTSVAAFGFVIHAITFSALTTGAVAFIGDVSPADHESELMGLRTTSRSLGGVLGPLLVGGLATVWGYEIAFVSMSVLAFIAAGIVVSKVVESHERSRKLTFDEIMTE